MTLGVIVGGIMSDGAEQSVMEQSWRGAPLKLCCFCLLSGGTYAVPLARPKRGVKFDALHASKVLSMYPAPQRRGSFRRQHSLMVAPSVSGPIFARLETRESPCSERKLSCPHEHASLTTRPSILTIKTRYRASPHGSPTCPCHLILTYVPQLLA